MFSVEQKRSIANAVQKILRDTGHPELPVGEIQFKLYVHGRFQWSWADIQNNAAVPVPSVNPWNEAQATPPDPQHGREQSWPGRKPWENIKPLAQYLANYLEHEHEDIESYSFASSYPDGSIDFDICRLEVILRQALDAYQLTENVTIKIERNVT
jgi:hypothetical protein